MPEISATSGAMPQAYGIRHSGWLGHPLACRRAKLLRYQNPSHFGQRNGQEKAEQDAHGAGWRTVRDANETHSRRARNAPSRDSLRSLDSRLGRGVFFFFFLHEEQETLSDCASKVVKSDRPVSSDFFRGSGVHAVQERAFAMCTCPWLPLGVSRYLTNT
ncbi:hypothetical protein LZ32DRAFT_191622 [Colletotrichum eremochloae]|nr:hypothetical protein LZ32DRAFT_191622 [Colletotrichum eremochloae]